MVRHCVKCGRVICEGKAAFYKPPLSDMCNHHRQEELDKQMKEQENCGDKKN